LRADPLPHVSVAVHGIGHHGGKTRGADSLQSQQRLAGPAERLGDDEVHTRFGRPFHLFGER
jgi:hypothetical protein